MFVEVHEQNPQKRAISQAVSVLKKGGIIIYPTDTVYSFGCDINNKAAIERILQLKQRSHSKPLTIVWHSLNGLSDYIRHMSDEAFKSLKRLTPGPYTFIFAGAKTIPSMLLTRQKCVGVRIPDNNIPLEITRELGNPIISTTVDTPEGEYIVEPAQIDKAISNCVDLVLDAGPKQSDLSTVIDFSGGTAVLVRQGKGAFPPII